MRPQSLTLMQAASRAVESQDPTDITEYWTAAWQVLVEVGLDDSGILSVPLPAHILEQRETLMDIPVEDIPDDPAVQLILSTHRMVHGTRPPEMEDNVPRRCLAALYPWAYALVHS